MTGSRKRAAAIRVAFKRGVEIRDIPAAVEAEGWRRPTDSAVRSALDTRERREQRQIEALERRVDGLRALVERMIGEVSDEDVQVYWRVVLAEVLK